MEQREMTEQERHTATVAELVAALQKGRVSVKFKKKDETVTERVFTLNPGLIKEAGYVFKAEDPSKPARAPNPDLLPMFQLGETDKSWKSMIRANMISFTVIEEPAPVTEKANG